MRGSGGNDGQAARDRDRSEPQVETRKVWNIRLGNGRGGEGEEGSKAATSDSNVRGGEPG